MLRIVLEGGRSDTERHGLDAAAPPTAWLAQDEQYEPVLSHVDEHLRDTSRRWRWRYRPVAPYREMPRSYEGARVRP